MIVVVVLSLSTMAAVVLLPSLYWYHHHHDDEDLTKNLFFYKSFYVKAKKEFFNSRLKVMVMRGPRASRPTLEKKSGTDSSRFPEHFFPTSRSPS